VLSFLITSNNTQEYITRYDDTCTLNTVCDVDIEIESDMSSPIFMYYRLENYYQNHRRYVKSRADEQLRGVVITDYNSLEDCDPLISVNNSHDPKYFYLPCGLIAASMFNDTFSVSKDNETLSWKRSGIAWPSDVKEKFNDPGDIEGVRVIDNFDNEDFIVWMRTAGLPTFKKLYAIFDYNLESGTYTVTVNNTYPVEAFQGTKSIVFSTTSWIGGRNPFLGYAYIIVGGICFILAIIFAVKHKISPRNLGDSKYLDWNQK